MEKSKSLDPNFWHPVIVTWIAGIATQVAIVWKVTRVGSESSCVVIDILPIAICGFRSQRSGPLKKELESRADVNSG
ncbi:hypothetical protein Moror_12051 [Moniliophthora roreri MCA 2997]|uniref:Uncharacterized protein n=2 Tax=Moniliophthora roreri TaxID=221103 RepID=V2WPV7_MONRO|nr:hypothetical protein Moror_12051 [Moniliophthora roreri MCA 2997]